MESLGGAFYTRSELARWNDCGAAVRRPSENFLQQLFTHSDNWKAGLPRNVALYG